MRKSIRTTLSAALAAAIFLGCQSSNGKKEPTQREKAEKEWSGARSAVLTSLASDQYKAGNFDKARQTVDQALKLTPDSEPLHLLSAKLAIENGQIELAESELKLARQFAPNDPEAYYLSGVIYQRWQKPETAFQFYQQASAKAPAELAYALAQAEMLVAMDRGPEALALLEAKVTYFEHSGTIRDAVGQLLTQAGRYKEAAAVFREASILSETDLGIRERLALALFYTKEYRDASDLLIKLVQNEPYNKRGDLFTILGECQLHLGHAREARYNLETASQLDAYSPHVWQTLGRAALESADLRRAELALSKSLTLDRSNGETHLLLGYVHLRQGRPQDALASFQKANELDKRDATALCMIGYALEKLGRSEESIQFYSRALRIKPDDEMASQLMAGVNPNDQK